MLEWLLNLKENIDRHGIRWGLALTLFAIYRKEKRNLLLDKRDEAIFHNQRIIMGHLGVGDQWHGPVKISNAEVQSLKRLYSLLRREIQSENQLRRKKKMTNLLSGKKKILTFILLVIINGLNDTLQLHLTQETITNISALGGGYIVVEGILDVVRAFVNRTPNQNQGGPSNGDSTPASTGPTK